MDCNELNSLVDECLDGRPDAIEAFQRSFGEIIYNYPAKVFRIPKDEIGDFYLYVFQKNRIFKRIKLYRNNGISFENYLKFFVLKHLAMEWLRELRKSLVKTESFAENLLDSVKDERNDITDSFEILHEDRFLIIRVYLMFEIDLSENDFRLIVQTTKRSYAEVAKLTEKIYKRLQVRSVKRKADIAKFDILDSRRCEYRRKWFNLEEEMIFAKNNKDQTLFEKLQEQMKELIRKYNWRSRQVEKLQQKVPDDTVTTPYKDIAELLNIPVGSVSSMLHHARIDFRKAYEASQRNQPK